ncbi:amino acid adenylation domain-containing protein, partial [Longimicrobium sp.]|uniref:amino acid adenylation domain-containing protein n=1 Tax=Longimicrobium sp. TaxID=2029185 RepID=UPI003B3A3F67
MSVARFAPRPPAHDRSLAEAAPYGCVHRLFQAQAARTPDAVAVEQEGVPLTYRELDQRADRLARRIAAVAGGSEARVGVLLERSPDVVAAQLAVMMAGGAFVPMDPAYPDDRLAYLAGDAGVRVVVTRAALRARVPAGATALCVDEDDGAAAGAALPAVRGENAAYVIYTSGSTGAPKGVVVPHAALANHALATAQEYGLHEGDRVLQFASPAFDVALEEVYPTLLRGAALVIRDERAMHSLASFLAFARERALTVWNLPSPYWHELVGELERSGTALPDALRLLVVGSEAASAEVLRSWRRIAGEAVAFRNAYGPTEATVTATVYAPPAEGPPADASTVPVGRALANVTAYVLDGRGEPAADGAPGELYLGGAGVARGYLDRPAATAAVFVPDAFSATPGARMYRTGDRARLRGGVLEFMGRVDRQVKVRGFRVEPEEVEAVLRTHPAVREAAVLLREDAPGRTRLVGYAAADEGVTPELLRAHLAGRLPAYMVPEAMIVLASLPVTPGGKVDRRALPAPAAPARAAGEAPREGTEARVAAVWEEVLRVENVSRGESFLGLGGNSLLAAQVVSRLHHALGVEMSIPVLLEASTVAGVAQAVERTASRPRTEPPRPRAGAIEGDWPVSLSQERAFFMSRLEPTSLAYQFQAALRFTGDLDVGVLERSLEEIIRRHAIFRTSFPESGGQPIQRVHPPMRVHLPVEDLRHVPAGERRAEADRRIRAELETPFDLTRPPLIRWRLIRLEDDVWEMAHVEHHIVHDGWSFNVFLADLLNLYRAYRDGLPSPLAEPALHFADYSAWQRAWLRGPEAADQLEFWSRYLAGAPPLIELPTDRPRPPVQRFRGGLRRIELTAAEAEALRTLGREHDATLFTVMLAGYALLMHRYSGQADVCIGTGVANRRFREVEGLIGMLVNTIVLRVGLEGDPTVAELLARTRTTSLQAFARQELPFDGVVQSLQPERSLSYNPLHQVAFSFDDARMPEVDVPGLEVTVVEGLSNGSAKYDMNIIVAPRAQATRFSDGWEAGGLTVLWEYDADLFDAATIDRMLQQYRHLLQVAARAPEMPAGAVPLLDDAGRDHVVHAWNRTEAAYPADRCIHQLFEARVRDTPGAVALVHEAESLTYGQLNARANQLARHLAGLGVRPESRVGICLERGMETPVCILAVLKAGVAYVPLDPGYPAGRLAAMLADSGAAVVLTQARLRDAWSGVEGVHVVPVDEAWGEIGRERADDLESGVAPGNLAYVIYTSGSTGTPKGVGVEHRALVNHMAWFNRAFAVSAGDRVLQKTSINFDASVWEFHAPLLAGGTLVMARHGGERDPGYLARTVRDAGITLLQLVPSVLAAVLDEPELAACTSLRQLFCGGEALPGELVRRFGAILPETRVVNLYGPTECCIDATTHLCGDADAARATVPIGTPAPNTRATVLDAALQPVPVGVPGELCIGGVQVARGYLGRPALTAERFVPDPFADGPGARMYRTGDRARWVERGETSADVRECVSADAGGNEAAGARPHAPAHELEYLGRLDAQVKIRGHRIEPGEVEAVLRRHPDVAGCAVLARADAGRDARLVAYVVGGADAGALREYLRGALPEHMVPSVFVPMETLPLTPNGKLDRRALPAPEPALSGDRYVAPRTPAEEVLAGIWAQVLRRDRVGVEDNFFELGGHSLLVTRIVSRVRDAFGVELPLRVPFEAPTVAQQAERVQAMRAAGLPRQAPVVPVDRTTPPPLSFAQERLWFLDEMRPEDPSYTIAVVLRLEGALNPAALERALGEVVRRHEALRTVFREQGGVPVQVVAPFDGLTLPVEDLSPVDADGREAEIERRAAAEAARPFHLARGPLVRPSLLRLADDDHVLLLMMHHAVADEWSMGVLFRELSALYAAYERGADAQLPPLPVQYADFAVWQRAHLRGDVLRRHLDYWTGQLGGAPTLLELPTDHPRPAVQSQRGALERFALPAELVERVRALGRGEGATPFMVLLAAFQVLLSKYSGSDDVVVGTPVAGRGRREVEELIGFFTNTLALRTDLSGDPAFREVLRRVRGATLDAWEHQELPFERVVAELQPERSRAHAPLVQVLFSLEDAEPARLRLAGVAARRMEAHRDTSKFDLTVAVSPEADGMHGVVEYSTDLFERGTVQRMMRHFVRVLEQVSADVDVAVSRLELLGDEERRTVVEGWNRTEAAYPADACIHTLVETSAARTPDAVAVVSGGVPLTYAELNGRANRLARHLVRLGVGPEVRVGV